METHISYCLTLYCIFYGFAMQTVNCINTKDFCVVFSHFKNK